MAHGTRDVCVDFNSLNKYGFNSNKKVLNRPQLKAVKRHNLSAELTKEELGYWNDPEGDEFIKQFSCCSMMDRKGDTQVESSKTSEEKNHEISDNEASKDNSELSSQTTGTSANNEEVVVLHPDKDSELDSTGSSPAVQAKQIKMRLSTLAQKNKSLAQANKLKKKAIDADLKAKQEEECLLKQEHDMLEYEVKKGEELQNSIEKYREKIRALKKRKAGEKKKRLTLNKSDEEFLVIPPSQPFSRRAFDEIKSKIGFACQRMLRETGLDDIIHENDLIAELMQKASARKKQRHENRESHRKKNEPAPSSMDSDSDSDDGSISEDSDGPGTGHRDGGAMRHKRRGKKLKSGITEKSREADISVKLKWASSILGSKRGSKREVSFENLTFDQYILGESQILNRPKISDLERNARIHLMKRISKLNEKIGFAKSKELYRETLLSIEKGEFSWENTYEMEKIENEIRFENMKVETSPEIKKPQPNELRWCKDFNFNKCTFNSHHQGRFGGSTVKLRHICRVCWNKTKDKKNPQTKHRRLPFRKERMTSFRCHT